jgi:flagellar biogenesis protein FliO
LIGLSGATLMGVAAGWLLRRRRTSVAATGPRLLNVTATLSLPHHCCAFLIQTGDRLFLAGTDAGGVRSIIALPTPPANAAENDAAPTETVLAPKLLEIRA